MQNNVEPDLQSRLDAVFAQLNPEAVEEFYAAYHQWSLQQRMSDLRQRIETVRAQQAENEQRLRASQPSAIALAALARLQSNGVSDIALLDAMLERGESWLDQTMQRLDYFEQFDDFISDDYTRWCQGALEGAFDWIDSLREDSQQTPSAQSEVPGEEAPENSEDAEGVKALLLQRLAIEREDDQSWQDAVTVKRPAIKTSVPESVTTESEIIPSASDEEKEEEEHPAPEDGAQQDAEIQVQPAEYIPQGEPAQSAETTIPSNTAGSSELEEQIIPEDATPVDASALSTSEPEQPALIEFAPIEENAPGEDELEAADDQPTLVESPAVEEAAATEDEPDDMNEQLTFVEFAAPSPSEVSMPEATSFEEVEQTEPSEIIVPEDVPAGEDTGQSEMSESQEIENSASEETVPHASYEETIPTIPAHRPMRNAPRKTGIIRGLIRLIFGS